MKWLCLVVFVALASCKTAYNDDALYEAIASRYEGNEFIQYYEKTTSQKKKNLLLGRKCNAIDNQHYRGGFCLGWIRGTLDTFWYLTENDYRVGYNVVSHRPMKVAHLFGMYIISGVPEYSPEKPYSIALVAEELQRNPKLVQHSNPIVDILTPKASGYSNEGNCSGSYDSEYCFAYARAFTLVIANARVGNKEKYIKDSCKKREMKTSEIKKILDFMVAEKEKTDAYYINVLEKYWADNYGCKL